MEDLEQDTPRLLDLEALKRRTGGDAELIQELVDMFLDHEAEMMDRIRQAVAQQDPVALKAAAHALKGSASNFGAAAVYESARALEHLGLEGRMDVAPEAFGVLELAMNLLCGEMRALDAGQLDAGGTEA